MSFYSTKLSKNYSQSCSSDTSSTNTMTLCFKTIMPLRQESPKGLFLNKGHKVVDSGVILVLFKISSLVEYACQLWMFYMLWPCLAKDRAQVTTIQKEKEGDLTQSWRNSLYQKIIQQPIDNAKTPPTTSITQRLWTVSWSNNSHPTGVVKPVYGYPTFPLTTTAV